MSRSYAGVLGLLAFFTATARGLIHGASAQSTLLTACLALVAFVAVGYFVGSLAAWNVEQSIRAQLAEEVARQTATAAGATRT